MPENSSSVTESLKAGNRVVAFGIAAIVLILLAAALFLFLNLPDANAFNARVERIFVDLLAACRPNKLAVEARFTRRGGLDINPFRTNETTWRARSAPDVRQ